MFLATAILCSAAIFTPVNFSTPQYGISYQPNGIPCYVAPVDTPGKALGYLAQTIDESYHEFLCGPVDYECSTEEDELGNRPLIGEGMLEACYRPIPPLDVNALISSFLCKVRLSWLDFYTNVEVKRFELRIPGQCTTSLRWAVVQRYSNSPYVTIMVNGRKSIYDLPQMLREAWPRVLFHSWEGDPEGCIE